MSEISAEAQTDELKKISGICDSFDCPIVIFDSNLECVYRKDVSINLKTKAEMYLKEYDSFKDCHFTTTIFVVKGVQYCAKIAGIDGYYVCALFDVCNLGKIAGYTDFFDKFLPIINEIEYSYSHLWDIVARLKKSGNGIIASDMEKYLSRGNLITRSTFEYIHILCHKPNPVRIECGSLLKAIVKRSNTLLANCGRSIDLVVSEEDCYINADKRHLMCAVVNAIQNALLYSPKDCVPSITIFKSSIENNQYVVFKIINENIGYVDEGRKLYENIMKIGTGIPAIKQFMKEVNGEFIIDDISGKVVTIMKFPAAKFYKKEALFFECDDFSYYDTGIPDFLELKLREVAELFKKDI